MKTRNLTALFLTTCLFVVGCQTPNSTGELEIGDVFGNERQTYGYGAKISALTASDGTVADTDELLINDYSDTRTERIDASQLKTYFQTGISSSFQPLDAQLTDLAALTPTDESVIKGDGTNFVTASNFRVDTGTMGNGTEMGTGVANGAFAVAQGYNTTASGDVSHAQGGSTTASGNFSHAQGSFTTASGVFSHAQGSNTQAIGSFSHAQGSSTTASGDYSHAGGRKAKATADGVFAISDSQDADFTVSIINAFGARFAGGYLFSGGAVAISSNLDVAGSIEASTWIDLPEQASDPAAPAANNARIFTKDNGSGKTQLVVRFATGAVQVIATEP